MKKEPLTVKTFLAIFVVIFGMMAISFVDIKDMVLGALIGYVGAILQYFFGSSTGSVAKDKVISDISSKTEPEGASITLIAKEADPLPEPEPEIGGGGIKNPKP